MRFGVVERREENDSRGGRGERRRRWWWKIHGLHAILFPHLFYQQEKYEEKNSENYLELFFLQEILLFFFIFPSKLFSSDSDGLINYLSWILFINFHF